MQQLHHTAGCQCFLHSPAATHGQKLCRLNLKIQKKKNNFKLQPLYVLMVSLRLRERTTCVTVLLVIHL